MLNAAARDSAIAKQQSGAPVSEAAKAYLAAFREKPKGDAAFSKLRVVYRIVCPITDSHADFIAVASLLAAKRLCVPAAGSQQLLVGSDGVDTPLFKYDDLIGVSDC